MKQPQELVEKERSHRGGRAEREGPGRRHHRRHKKEGAGEEAQVGAMRAKLGLSEPPGGEDPSQATPGSSDVVATAGEAEKMRETMEYDRRSHRDRNGREDRAERAGPGRERRPKKPKSKSPPKSPPRAADGAGKEVVQEEYVPTLGKADKWRPSNDHNRSSNDGHRRSHRDGDRSHRRSHREDRSEDSRRGNRERPGRLRAKKQDTANKRDLVAGLRTLAFAPLLPFNGLKNGVFGVGAAEKQKGSCKKLVGRRSHKDLHASSDEEDGNRKERPGRFVETNRPKPKKKKVAMKPDLRSGRSGREEVVSTGDHHHKMKHIRSRKRLLGRERSHMEEGEWGEAIEKARPAQRLVRTARTKDQPKEQPGPKLQPPPRPKSKSPPRATAAAGGGISRTRDTPGGKGSKARCLSPDRPASPQESKAAHRDSSSPPAEGKQPTAYSPSSPQPRVSWASADASSSGGSAGAGVDGQARPTRSGGLKGSRQAGLSQGEQQPPPAKSPQEAPPPPKAPSTRSLPALPPAKAKATTTKPPRRFSLFGGGNKPTAPSAAPSAAPSTAPATLPRRGGLGGLLRVRRNARAAAKQTKTVGSIQV